VFRARGIPASGKRVYHPRREPSGSPSSRTRRALRAEALYAELDVLRHLRPTAKAAMVTEAPAGSRVARAADHPVLRIGPRGPAPGHDADTLAVSDQTKPVGLRRLAVVTRSSADYALVAGQAVRRRRPPLTRGLNRNHNRVLKDVFKGAATAATARPGPLQDFYHSVIARGTREELARLTLTRKLAALTLRLWKKGERYDPTKLTTPAR